jgi:hypothetical protein
MFEPHSVITYFKGVKKMERKIFSIGLTVFITILVSAAWAGPQINPGKWEITTRTEMQGMPPQSETHIQCLTDENVVPMSKEASQECRVEDIVVKGNTVSWKIFCGGQGGQMEGTGQITYQGDSMEGVMHMAITGANMEFINHITGRRIGECDAQTTGSSQAPPKTTAEPPKVEKTISEDAKDVGKAARDEAKQSTVDEVRKGVRGVFKGLFD